MKIYTSLILLLFALSLPAQNMVELKNRLAFLSTSEEIIEKSTNSLFTEDLQVFTEFDLNFSFVHQKEKWSWYYQNKFQPITTVNRSSAEITIQPISTFQKKL